MGERWKTETQMRGNFDRKDEKDRTRMEILSSMYPRNGEGRERNGERKEMERGEKEMERGEKEMERGEKVMPNNNSFIQPTFSSLTNQNLHIHPIHSISFPITVGM